MSGIRINAAAEMLGVSASTLRSWERRLGYPNPHRTPGNHRLYLLDEVEALREALRETHNISSAVEVARMRGRGPASPARLVSAFEGFDEVEADRELEESLAVRSVERTVSEVLLPALEMAAQRPNGEGRARIRMPLGNRVAAPRSPALPRRHPRGGRPPAGLRLAHRCRVGPRAGARALPAPLRPPGSSAFDRAGRGPLPQRPSRPLAARRRDLRIRGAPRRSLRAAARPAQLRRDARLYGFRAARLVAGRDGVPSLGQEPGEATDELLTSLS